MKDITEITAKDIMSKDIKTINTNDTLNKAISILNNEHLHNLLVYDNDKYKGIFGFKQLTKLHRRPPSDTKINDFTFKPPILSEDTSIIDIVEHMYRLNHKIMPIGDEKKITGVVSESDILNSILQFNLLGNKKAKDLMTPDPLTLNENDSLGKAMAQIREHNISRIPIINKDNKLSGFIESLDLIRKITTKEQYGRDSGTSSSSGYIKPNAYTSELISDHKIPISSLMSTNPITTKAEDNLEDKIKDTLNLGISTIIITDDNNYPTGIIAPKDIIQFLAALKETEKVHIQISGLETISNIDEFEMTEIHRILDKTVKKLANVTKIINFTIHAKRYHIEGNKTKYTFRCKFTSNSGPIFAKNSGWNSIDTFSGLMEEIEKRTLKVSKKHTDITRSIRRDAKYNID